MAEVTAGFLGVALQVVKWVGGPIIRQFNYLCCFPANIRKLGQEAEKLHTAAGEIQVKVVSAENNGLNIRPKVKAWLKNYNSIKAQSDTISLEEPHVRSGCSKLGPRFSLSKRAKKTAESMKELQDECINLGDDVSLPGPPLASKPVRLEYTYEFESRKQTEEDIMEVLKAGDERVIGIYGMGGLGKTTMAKRIMNRVLEDGVFQEIVIANFGQHVDKCKIQLEISGPLDLEIDANTSEAVREDKLHSRLSCRKRILLVLDDVWKDIKLEEFGIPRDSKRCTVLITSRNRDVLCRMDVKKKFEMKILSEDEALDLFGNIVGTCMDDDELKPIAKEIVKEGTKLPIVLATIGEVLKEAKVPYVWWDTRRQLSQCNPDGQISPVYNSLKRSYDFLSLDAKSIFLLCCLFPEVANIPLEFLACFCMGLGIFGGITNLKEMRDRVFTLITMLKDLSLLLDSEKSDYVRMNDVLPVVCTIIPKQERYVGINDCQWISSFELSGEGTKQIQYVGRNDYSWISFFEQCRETTKLPNLRRLLYLRSDYKSKEEEEFKSGSAFSEGSGDLYVLCIHGYKSLSFLPPTHSLKNLKSLVLDSCRLKTLSVVGEFVNLEILICRDCPLIKELPLEMKTLNHMKLLELTRCENLQTIGQGMISSLSRLEELKMFCSFKRWESEDKEERENAGLRELKKLRDLRSLEIEIEDPALAAQKMHLSSKINRIHIRIGEALEFDYDFYSKKMVLESKREEPCLGKSIGMQLLRETKHLYLSGNGANSVDLAKCQKIEKLYFKDCETISTLVVVDDATAVLASLKHLNLCNLSKLQRIYDVPPIFTNLSSINIEGCHHLCHLGKLSIAGKDCFPQLEELVMQRCEVMKQVFLWSDSCITKVFPKLKTVKLSNMRSLETFCQGMGGFGSPLLELYIEKCPKLRSIGSNDNSGGSGADIEDHSSQHLFCQQKEVSFNLKALETVHQLNPFCGHEIPLSLLKGLEVLKLSELNSNTSLFTSSVAGNLDNLRVLNITKCKEMLKVIAGEEKVVSGGEVVLFPKLVELELNDLPKLVSFCEWKCNIKLLSLRDVVIRSCSDLRRFTMGSSIADAQNLENVEIDYEYVGGIKNLNSLDKLEKRRRAEEEIKDGLREGQNLHFCNCCNW